MHLRARQLSLVAFFASLSVVTPAMAQSITLQWDACTDTQVAGYVLQDGTRSGVYTNAIDVGNQTTASVETHDPNERYFFVVQSYDTAGTRSDLSPEVSNDAIIVRTDGAVVDGHPGIFWQNQKTGQIVTWHLRARPF